MAVGDIYKTLMGVVGDTFSIGLGAIKATLTASSSGLNLNRSLTVDGFGGKVRVISSGVTLSDEYLVLCNAAGGGFTVSLPALGTYPERTYRIVKTDVSTNIVTIDGDSSETINGDANFLLTAPGDVVEVTDATTDWKIANRLSAAAIHPPTACRLATTGDIADLAAGAPSSVDGVNVAVTDRILVWQQNSAEFDAENGPYVVDVVGSGANGQWSRARDFNSGPKDQIGAGLKYYIQEGTDNNRSEFTLVTTGVIVVGTTPTQWVPGEYIVRSDASETSIKASGAFATSWAFSSAMSTRDFAIIYATIEVTNRGTNNAFFFKAQTSSKATPAVDADWSDVLSDDDITAGATTAPTYVVEKDISALSSTTRWTFRFPCGVWMRFGVYGDVAADGAFQLFAARKTE